MEVAAREGKEEKIKNWLWHQLWARPWECHLGYFSARVPHFIKTELTTPCLLKIIHVIQIIQGC